MKSKFTISMLMACAIFFTGCSKDEFSEQDAVNAQKELLNLKYQHELDLETLKQKGATAMQQLLNAAALEQLKLNDSLANKSAIAAKKADYSVAVTDYYSNAPVADADVTVSSEGKLFSAKTNAQGVATFTSLYLFPTSTFLVSKTGYAATRINQQFLSTPVRLWNNTELTNEISGSLFIETDLTNTTAERVGANVLVTATTNIATPTGGSYSVFYPTYTDANGSYSMKLPASPSGYSLTFEQITAEQKLYVNATEDNANTTFPSSLPRIGTIRTYFNVNSNAATIPNVSNYYYFKFAPDINGKVMYLPGQVLYYYNTVYASLVNGKYQIERLNVYNNYSQQTTIDLNMATFASNAKIDVELVDITGTLIEQAPKLMATTGSTGKLLNNSSPEGGSGYVHLKRNDDGTLAAEAKGRLSRANLYESFSNLYTLSPSSSLNTVSGRPASSTTFISANKGDKKVVNFSYGSGESRVKQVY